jgi:hypothetical protein
MAKPDPTTEALNRVRAILKNADGNVMVEVGVSLVGIGLIRLKDKGGIQRAVLAASAASSVTTGMHLDLLKTEGVLG